MTAFWQGMSIGFGFTVLCGLAGLSPLWAFAGLMIVSAMFAFCFVLDVVDAYIEGNYVEAAVYAILA